jgi:hypothetical protein
MLSKDERFELFLRRLADAEACSSAREALSLLSSILNAI